jgi:competence protein ComEA
MKRRRLKPLVSCFILCCAALCVAPACVKLSRRAPPAGRDTTLATREERPRISLNRASQAELERLPGVGPSLAARIIAHRERYGPFRRVEHLLLVRGFGERRFHQLQPFITAE